MWFHDVRRPARTADAGARMGVGVPWRMHVVGAGGESITRWRTRTPPILLFVQGLGSWCGAVASRRGVRRRPAGGLLDEECVQE